MSNFTIAVFAFQGFSLILSCIAFFIIYKKVKEKEEKEKEDRENSLRPFKY